MKLVECVPNFSEGRDEATLAALREKLVEQHIGLVEFLARRFRNRGEPLEDLVQVGTIGLLKAIERFDLDREVEFSTYATPTIVGELKRPSPSVNGAQMVNNGPSKHPLVQLAPENCGVVTAESIKAARGDVRHVHLASLVHRRD